MERNQYIKSVDLELFSTEKNQNPKHAYMLKKLEEKSRGYVNIEMESMGDYTFSGSGFIISYDGKYIYILTAKHCMRDPYLHDMKYEILDLNFTENSLIRLKELNSESKLLNFYRVYESDNLDLAVIKLSTEILDFKEIYVQTFSLSMDIGLAVSCMGNALGFGTSVSFGNIKSIDTVIDKIEKRYLIFQFSTEMPKIKSLEYEILSYEGCSGGPIFDLLNFDVVGLHNFGNILSEKKFYSKKIYNKQYLEERSKAERLKSHTGPSIWSVESDEEKLESDEYHRYLGFNAEQYIEDYAKYPDADQPNHGYAIFSKDIVNEINLMKEKFVELSDLQLKISPSSISNDSHAVSLKKSVQEK